MTESKDRVEVRPRKIRIVSAVAAGAIFVLFTLVAIGLRGPMEGGRGIFEVADQLAMIGLGIIGALGVLAFGRPRAIADSTGIRVRNVLGSYELPWSAVRSIHFDRGAPWASLELENDDVVSVMAVQRNDKEHAVASLRALREIHEAATRGA